MVIKRIIVWDDVAKKQLRQIYNYIKQDSVQNAQQVKKNIILAIKEIPKNPERYPADQLK